MTSKFPSYGNKVGVKSEVFGDKEQSEWISMNREPPPTKLKVTLQYLMQLLRIPPDTIKHFNNSFLLPVMST